MWKSKYGELVLRFWQGKPKYSAKNLSRYQFVHHKSHTRIGLELKPKVRSYVLISKVG
jgi:hypothetical protein